MGMGITNKSQNRMFLTALTIVSASLLFGASNAYAGVATVPGAVTDLTPTVMSATQVDLAWTSPDDGGSVITGYFIQNKIDGIITSIETNYGDATSVMYSDMSLLCDYSVQYRIAAINAIGQGPFSNIPAPVTTDACAGGDLQPLWDAIAVVEAAVAQLQADFAALQTQVDNIGSTGLDVGGDIQLDGDILSTNDICIGACA